MSLFSSLNHLSSTSSASLLSGFRNSFIRDPFRSNTTDNFGTVFTNPLARIPYETQFLTHVRFLFFIFYCRVVFKFFFQRSKSFFYSWLVMLSLFQSTVNCSSRNAESNFTHKLNCRYYSKKKYRYYFHFPGLEFVYLKA